MAQTYYIERTEDRCWGGSGVTYSAWVRTHDAGSEYSTFTSSGNFALPQAGEGQRVTWYGLVTTRRLTPELDALPARSDARLAAVQAYHEALRQEAYAAILAAYPEIAGLAEFSRGEAKTNESHTTGRATSMRVVEVA